MVCANGDATKRGHECKENVAVTDPTEERPAKLAKGSLPQADVSGQRNLNAALPEVLDVELPVAASGPCVDERRPFGVEMDGTLVVDISDSAAEGAAVEERAGPCIGWRLLAVEGKSVPTHADAVGLLRTAEVTAAEAGLSKVIARFSTVEPEHWRDVLKRMKRPRQVDVVLSVERVSSVASRPFGIELDGPLVVDVSDSAEVALEQGVQIGWKLLSVNGAEVAEVEADGAAKALRAAEVNAGVGEVVKASFGTLEPKIWKDALKKMRMADSKKGP